MVSIDGNNCNYRYLLYLQRSITINVELVYNFGISINLNDINVDKFIEETVVINIPKDKLKIQYIQLNKQSKVNSSNTLLSKQFKPEDLKIIQENAVDKITNNINNDKNISNESLISLKENLSSLILKLGYKEVVFNEL